jgi:hypothetical protein
VTSLCGYEAGEGCAFTAEARINIWFGEDGKHKAAGDAQGRSVEQHKTAAATGVARLGPTCYRNRRQYFGPDLLVETHTVTWSGQSSAVLQ